MKHKQSKLELTVHSGIAHMTYILDAVAVKTWFYLVTRVFDYLENSDQQLFSIPSKDLFDYLGTRNYEHIREILESIRQTGIRFNILGKDPRKNWITTSLLSAVGIEEGQVIFEIPLFLKQKLLAYKEMFVVINLMLLRDFNSKHTLALYIVIEDFLFKNIDQTEKIFTVEELKDLFGVEKDQYQEFKEFNKFVLKKAVQEINKKSNLIVSYKPYEKNKQKILSLKFTFKVLKKLNTSEQKVQLSLDDSIAEPKLFTQPIIKPTIITQEKQKNESKYILPKSKEVLQFANKYAIEFHWPKHQTRLKELLNILGNKRLEEFFEYCIKYTLQENNRGVIKMDSEGNPNIANFFMGLLHKQERLDAFLLDLEKEEERKEELERKIEEEFMNKLQDIFEDEQNRRFKKHILEHFTRFQDKLSKIIIETSRENGYIKDKIVTRFRDGKLQPEQLSNPLVWGQFVNYYSEFKYAPIKFDDWYKQFSQVPENQEKIKGLRDKSR